MSRVFTELDRSSPVPLYFQVAEQLESAIRSGTLAPGDKISNEVVLAAELGLSRPTMRQAIQLLVDRGLLVRKRGVGTQVVHGQVRRPVELTSLYDDLAAAGQTSETEVLALKLVPADEEVAGELNVAPDTSVWFLERLRAVGGEPLALMHNYLPPEMVPLDTIDLTSVGLYAGLRARGIHIRVARQRIGARRAESREARLLGERKGAPLLTMRRTAYNDAGNVVEFGTHIYLPERYSFESTLVDR